MQKIQDKLRSVKDAKDPSLLEVYTGFHVVVEMYTLGPQRDKLTLELKNTRETAALTQAEKLALAEHSLLYPEHKILSEETTMLRNEKHYHPRLYLEAIEIFKHKNCLNRKEEGPQN